ncbi:hypothetical protein ACWGJB_23460 [Streptomyces sp. NPDC054813]
MRLHTGTARINDALTSAMSEGDQELLCLHLAKLATTLGCDSHAQLCCLIGRSGILKPEAGP